MTEQSFYEAITPGTSVWARGSTYDGPDGLWLNAAPPQRILGAEFRGRGAVRVVVSTQVAESFPRVSHDFIHVAGTWNGKALIADFWAPVHTVSDVMRRAGLVGPLIDAQTFEAVSDSIPAHLVDQIVAIGSARDDSLVVVTVPLLHPGWVDWVDTWRGVVLVQVKGFLHPVEASNVAGFLDEPAAPTTLA